MSDDEITTLRNQINTLTDEEFSKLSKKVVEDYDAHRTHSELHSNSSYTLFNTLLQLEKSDSYEQKIIKEKYSVYDSDKQKSHHLLQLQTKLTQNEVGRKNAFFNYVADDKNNGKKLLKIIQEAVNSVVRPTG